MITFDSNFINQFWIYIRTTVTLIWSSWGRICSQPFYKVGLNVNTCHVLFHCLIVILPLPQSLRTPGNECINSKTFIVLSHIRSLYLCMLHKLLCTSYFDEFLVTYSFFYIFGPEYPTLETKTEWLKTRRILEKYSLQ